MCRNQYAVAFIRVRFESTVPELQRPKHIFATDRDNTLYYPNALNLPPATQACSFLRLESIYGNWKRLRNDLRQYFA
jgi:hypothetical protein